MPATSPPELLAAVLQDPPVAIGAILSAGGQRIGPGVPPPEPPKPPSFDNREEYMLQDAGQQRDALWRSFQDDLRYMLLHRNDPPPRRRRYHHGTARPAGPRLVARRRRHRRLSRRTGRARWRWRCTRG